MPRKSIVMVTVDCMRADHVGFMGYHRPTTPFFDSLSADSFIFPAAIVAGTPTYFSLPAPSSRTSLPPLRASQIGRSLWGGVGGGGLRGDVTEEDMAKKKKKMG